MLLAGGCIETHQRSEADIKLVTPKMTLMVIVNALVLDTSLFINTVALFKNF